MLLFAHRGYHAVSPENTLAAFEAAVRLGVDGIETDIRLSADGLPVVIHDRITPSRRAVNELTHDEIERDVGHAVPVLSEILDAFAGVAWNIEIKTPEAWPAASRVLAQYRANRRLLVSSFCHDVVRRCADELSLDCALLLANRPLDVGAVIEQCGRSPAIKAIVWDYNIVDQEVLAGVAQHGWRSYAYGAITAAEHERCRTLGLAGLITDFPQLAAENRA